MKQFKRYRAISALAGSGKTYQLTSRFIALLAMGFEPSRIVAITFTRKAAGEIFDRIICRLAKASLDPESFRELEEALQLQANDPAYRIQKTDPARWLAGLLDAMADLRIGTIDSFFGSLLKAFAPELGLPPRLEIIDGVALENARDEALSHAFARLEHDDGSRDEFREAFKTATSARKRDVRSSIHEVIEDDHQILMALPDRDAWGNVSRIWKDRMPWWMPGSAATVSDVAGRVDRFMVRLKACGHSASYLEAWEKIAESLRAGRWDELLDDTLPKRLFEQRNELASGKATIQYGKSGFLLAGADAEDAYYFIQVAAYGIFRRLLDLVQGRWRLIHTYEQAFNNQLRKRGRFTFADVPLMLGEMCDEDVKLDIGYRLDHRIDHWLIDEFQDTNVRQWQIIGRLADEVLQSTEPDRSFFYVGDVKQAIYGWRGGQSSLFNRVRDYYENLFDRNDSLAVSWRSSPVVLAFVNLIFGNTSRSGTLCQKYESVVSDWKKQWEAHQAAGKNDGMPGRVEWHKIGKKEEFEDAPGRIVLSCRIVEDLLRKDVGRIAILVRTNKYGNRIANYFRARGITVRREADPVLRDNPVVSALLSLLHGADHPDDKFCWSHIAMTPLKAAIEVWVRGRASSPDQINVFRAVREVASRSGVSGLLGEIIDSCRKLDLLRDDFTELRLRQLLDAAADFDRDAGTGTSDFARLAADMKVSDPGGDGRVIVMTVHKAKGLEFDAVVLPELDGQWDAHDAGALKTGGEIEDRDGNPSEPSGAHDAWVFPVPKKEATNLDPVMDRFVKQIAERRVRDEICLLYVAITRARQGLYLISEEAGEKSKSLTSGLFMDEVIPPHGAGSADYYPGTRSVMRYQSGSPAWAQRDSSADKKAGEIIVEPAKSERITGGAEAGLKRRLMDRTPSGEERNESFRKADLLFMAGKRSASRRGTLLHDLFSLVEWSGQDAGPDALRDYESAHGECPAEIRSEFQSALAAPDVDALMRRPEGLSEVWREQPFEYSDGTSWISGRMDRVVVLKDDGGRVTGAHVIDFKTDRSDIDDLEALKKRYEPQLRLYAETVAGMLGLSISSVRASLILTAKPTVVSIDSYWISSR